MDRCGRLFTGEEPLSFDLRCQLKAGHGGAHLAEVTEREALKRYWWVPLTGEYGVNHYQAHCQSA